MSTVAVQGARGEMPVYLTTSPGQGPLPDRAWTSGLQYLIGQGMALNDAVELYQSLDAFTVGYSMLGSPSVETAWAGSPEKRAERLRESRESTFPDQEDQ